MILTGAKRGKTNEIIKVSKINKRIHLYSYINRRPDRPRTTQSCLRPRRPNKHVWKKTRVKTAYKASRINSNVKKNWTFYCNHTCAAALVHSTFQLWLSQANHFHATESISFLADLYSSSLLTKASLFSIKAGSSSNIALSCFFWIMKAKQMRER